MSKFNQTKPTNKTTNLAGGKAFKMDARSELTHAVLTTFLEDKFYESGNDRIDRIKELVALNKPEFVANLAFVARTEFHLRSVSHLLLGELAKVHKGDDLVKRAIVACAIRPDDLIEIFAYLGKPLPKQVKRGIRNALYKFNRYQLAKYKAEGKKYSMIDLFNVVHPKAQFANDEQKQAWSDLMNGDLISTDTWESKLSKNPSAKAFEDLILENKMGYMAVLRNLNNFDKYGISKEAQDLVIAKLVDPEEIRKSKQLPFRFYNAYKNVSNNRVFLDAISEAMDLSVSNVPNLGGKTLIAIDTSGSMSGCIDKASVFGATLMKANVGADVILYDTRVGELVKSSRIPVVDLTESIIKSAMGGGTQTSLVFEYAQLNGVKYDRIIIISDSESWNEHSVQHSYNLYKTYAKNDPFVYAIDIEGYGSSDIIGSKVKHLAGWSDRLLDFISAFEKGDELVEYISNLDLLGGEFKND